MSNKAHDRLWETDKFVRQHKPTAMMSGVRLRIEFICGFELFNTRPYHNYETWSQGWRITDMDEDIIVEREDLDDALHAWRQQVDEHKAKAAQA